MARLSIILGIFFIICVFSIITHVRGGGDGVPVKLVDCSVDPNEPCDSFTCPPPFVQSDRGDGCCCK
ncbi:CLUMA_CG012096, isoform A [Clunio marinus]|uniref:CLUMA_CG012096, isoform A n=1 Tax=Clunio marinus TaxID=568069 RepID=A0A1J1IFI4_9DIPT|nr:CLUMA_CG012096, isoform A [Clunio marinus]